MLQPKYRTKVPIFEPNLSSPSGLIFLSVSRIFNLAFSCAPGYVFGQTRSIASLHFFTWLVLGTRLAPLAMFKVVFATDLFYFFQAFRFEGATVSSPSQPPTLGISTTIILSKIVQIYREDFVKLVRNSSPLLIGGLLAHSR
jgi:hypothetical protein